MHTFALSKLLPDSVRLVSTLLNGLIVSILFLSYQTHAVTLSDSTANFLQSMKFTPATDDSFFCAPYKRTFVAGWPQADYILNTANADNVIIFVHGFVPTKYGGRQKLNDMVRTWQNHIGILPTLKSDTSYCVVTWDTEYGVDDPEAKLAHLITSLYIAMNDNRLGRQKRNIILVGHSAGGNYIKYALNESYDFINRCCSKMLADRSRFGTRSSLKVVTLATPHLGTEFATDALFYAGMGKIFVNLFLGSDAATGMDFFINKAASRGAAQLRPIHLNPHLSQINQKFISWFGQDDIWAIGSETDDWVSYTSAAPRSMTTPFKLNVGHEEFLRPQPGTRYYRWLSNVYTGAK